MTGDTGQQIDTDHDKGAGFVDVWVETGGIRARRHYGCTARQHLLGVGSVSAITAAAEPMSWQRDETQHDVWTCPSDNSRGNRLCSIDRDMRGRKAIEACEEVLGKVIGRRCV